MFKKSIYAALIFSLFALLWVPASAEKEGDPEIKLKYKQLKNIAKIFTPGRLKKRITSNINLPNGQGRGLACDLNNQRLIIDTNLDGKPDKRVGKNGQLVELWIQEEDEKKKKYSVYITYDASTVTKQWFYESATAVTGVLGGTKIFILDDNCNASFADFGEDGIILGSDKGGWFLSSAISVGKNLYEIDVDPKGESLSYVEYTGDLGLIDPMKKLKDADFKPKIFVVKQEDRSFNILRDSNKKVKVPTGRYTIERGIINHMTEFLGAKHPPFEVLKGNTTVVEWGGPFTMLFNEPPSKDYPPMIYGTSASHKFLKGKISDPHLLYLEPPYIMGEKGEVYVGTKKWCKPEQPLKRPGGQQIYPYPPARISYKVEILNRKTKRSINHDKYYSGNWPEPQPGAPAPYYWVPFMFSYGDHRGKYILRVTTMATSIFKDAIYEVAIDLK